MGLAAKQAIYRKEIQKALHYTRKALSGESKLKQQKDHLKPIRLQKGESWMLLSVGRHVA